MQYRPDYIDNSTDPGHEGSAHADDDNETTFEIDSPVTIGDGVVRARGIIVSTIGAMILITLFAWTIFALVFEAPPIP